MNVPNCCITAVSTAVPKYTIYQHEVERLIQQLFVNAPEATERLLRVFANDHIHTRNFVRPLQWYSQPRGFGESNAVFISEAIQLSVTAVQKVLAKAGLEPKDISALIIATTTGLATPSIDAFVAQEAGFDAGVTRLPIVGLGCAAGVSGLARAAEICAARNGKPVVFVAVEVCSVTFQHSDSSKSNIVGASLFGDGAAAVVIQGEEHGIQIKGYSSFQFPESYDVMGWDVVDSGLKVRFSRDIPTLVHSSVQQLVTSFLSTQNTTLRDVQNIVAHPGGAKVLDSYAQALDRNKQDFYAAADILHNHGNMSSPTVLFVLEKMWEQVCTTKQQSLMMALGPGFSADFILLRST